MDHNRPLAPCLIGSGTLTSPRDMIRALETLEALDYEYEIDGQTVAEGSATLVKLMADGGSATLAVNGCLFLNVASFRYLDFCVENDVAVMRLFGDGTTLTLRSDADAENPVVARGQLRLLEESPFDLESFVVMDDDEDED
ncbi:MAG: hypothetical protein U1E22_03580 [Coriobacteriia bacterium]|nr:hypothetical protein [Coriobacteriia bacterium]